MPRLHHTVGQPREWGHLACAQVVKSTQALEDLKELAASDSVDTFVLSYTSLLQASALGLLLMRSSACVLMR